MSESANTVPVDPRNVYAPPGGQPAPPAQPALQPPKEPRLQCVNISTSFPRYQYSWGRDPVIRVTTTCCCGVKELTNLTGAQQKGILEKELLNVAKVVRSSCAFVLFEGVVKEGGGVDARGKNIYMYPTYGHEFKALIEEKGLGTVFESEAKRNPNSGNDLVTFLWTLDQEKIGAWVEQELNREKVQSIEGLAVNPPS